MSSISITFDEAKNNFPEAVKQILAEMQKSKAKAKTIPPEKYKWSIQ